MRIPYMTRKWFKIKETDWKNKTMTIEVKKNIWFWIVAISTIIAKTKIEIIFFKKYKIALW